MPAAAAAGGTPARCCADPSAFHYEPLPAEGSVDFVIDKHSPTFEFQSGPSPYRAFALPQTDRGYLLEVRSFLQSPQDPRRAQVFYPVVAILTDDYLVSRTTELESLSFDLPFLERTLAPAYRVALPLGPGNGRERYVVVFTPAKLATLRALPPIAGPDSAADAARVAFLGAVGYGHLRITLRAGGPAPVAPPIEAPPP
jgi:Maltose operon periplasmic protein precursor (MalM)